MSLDFHGPGLWYATRATGLVAMLLLTVSVLFGIITVGRFASENWPRFLSQGLHRNTSLLVLAFLALHVGTTVVDTYTSIPLAAAFVPFASAYRTAWLGLGDQLVGHRQPRPAVPVAVRDGAALEQVLPDRVRIGHPAWIGVIEVGGPVLDRGMAAGHGGSSVGEMADLTVRRLAAVQKMLPAGHRSGLVARGAATPAAAARPPILHGCLAHAVLTAWTRQPCSKQGPLTHPTRHGSNASPAQPGPAQPGPGALRPPPFGIMPG